MSINLENSQPLVSVIIPTYNRLQYLKEAINHLKIQDMVKFRQDSRRIKLYYYVSQLSFFFCFVCQYQ